MTSPDISTAPNGLVEKVAEAIEDVGEMDVVLMARAAINCILQEMAAPSEGMQRACREQGPYARAIWRDMLTAFAREQGIEEP